MVYYLEINKGEDESSSNQRRMFQYNMQSRVARPFEVFIDKCLKLQYILEPMFNYTHTLTFHSVLLDESRFVFFHLLRDGDLIGFLTETLGTYPVVFNLRVRS